MSRITPFLAAALCLGATSASAVVFEYQGNPLTMAVGNGPHPTGPLTAMVEFDDLAFIANANLDETNIVSFLVQSTNDGLSTSNLTASFVEAAFTVNAAGIGFDSWGLVVEDELVGSNTGPEQIAIENMGLYGSIIDEIAYGDDSVNSMGAVYETGAFNTEAGTWTRVAPIPLPAAGLLLACGMAGLALLRRRRPC